MDTHPEIWKGPSSEGESHSAASAVREERAGLGNSWRAAEEVTSAEMADDAVVRVWTEEGGEGGVGPGYDVEGNSLTAPRFALYLCVCDVCAYIVCTRERKRGREMMLLR